MKSDFIDHFSLFLGFCLFYYCLISYLSQCCYQTVSILTRHVLDSIALLRTIHCILYLFLTSCKHSNVQTLVVYRLQILF